MKIATAFSGGFGSIELAMKYENISNAIIKQELAPLQPHDSNNVANMIVSVVKWASISKKISNTTVVEFGG